MSFCFDAVVSVASSYKAETLKPGAKKAKKKQKKNKKHSTATKPQFKWKHERWSLTSQLQADLLEMPRLLSEQHHLLARGQKCKASASLKSRDLREIEPPV